MTYIILILFFGSFLGIIIMIGRKLLILKNGQLAETTVYREEFTPDLRKVKYLVLKKSRRWTYLILFVAVRFYVKSSDFAKDKYKEMKTKIKNLRASRMAYGNGSVRKSEVSGFLKIISAYKEKIRKIRDRIKQEENF